MKESQKNEIKTKPGLEEALHPDIANGSLWVNEVSSFSLSIVDPLKALDTKLLDEATAANTLQLWKLTEKEESIESPVEEIEIQSLESGIALPPDAKTSDTKELMATDSDEPLKSIPEEEPPVSIPSAEDEPPKKEKKKKEKDPLKVSKRIRKLAEKEQKEEDARNEKASPISASPAETNLSPFTNWLKGLSGSEYVHPYEDDFAFKQGNEGAGEGISETFADLLAAQGYKDQAIAMFTRLIEKFPEKSRFFAAKIEALQ